MTVLQTVHQGAHGAKCPFEAALDAKMVQLRTQLDPASEGAAVPVVIHCRSPKSDPEVKVIDIIDGEAAKTAAGAGEKIAQSTAEAKPAEAPTKTAVVPPAAPPATPEKKIPANPVETPTKAAVVPPIATPEKTVPAKVAPSEVPPPGSQPASSVPKPQIPENSLPPSISVDHVGAAAAATETPMESLKSSPVLLAGVVGVCCLFIGTFFWSRSSSSARA